MIKYSEVKCLDVCNLLLHVHTHIAKCYLSTLGGRYTHVCSLYYSFNFCICLNIFIKNLGGEEGTWHHGKKMSFRVTEIWIRILTLLSLGPPNIIPELCSSEPVTGRNPQMLVPSFLPSRHRLFSLPLFMNWSVDQPIPELPTASSPFQTRQRTPSNSL